MSVTINGTSGINTPAVTLPSGSVNDASSLTTGSLDAARLPTQLGISGSASAGSLNIDASGRVTMPYQPSFRAYNSGTISSAGIMVWDAAIDNVGGHYNTSTGLFTAPVNGTYQFNISWVLNNLTTYFWGQLQINGLFIFADFHTTNATTAYQGRSISHVVRLNAGDTFGVWVGGTGGGSIEALRSTISGCLIG